jgi:hypothetical protein
MIENAENFIWLLTTFYEPCELICKTRMGNKIERLLEHRIVE